MVPAPLSTGNDAQHFKGGKGVKKMRTQLTITELDAQHVELLPARETLYYHNNWSHIWASNSAVAMNLGTYHSYADANAYQHISVNQR